MIDIVAAALRCLASAPKMAATAALNRKTVCSDIDCGQTISAHDHLPGLTPIPTLVVWGARDRLIPAGHAERARSAFADARVEIFEDAGHFPHLEEPERFAGVLSDFMAARR